MPPSKRKRRERRRAGSSRRDSEHRTGGDWTALSLPEGVELWQPKAKSYRIDVVPYEVGEGNPYADKGMWYYERTYYAHRGVGPANATYVCPAKTAGKRCPICEYRGKLASDPDADEKLIDQLKPKERQLWLIYDHDEPDKGVQLWDFSHWNFGRLLDKMRNDADEDETFITDFDDPEAGASLKVSFDEEKGGGYSYLVAYNIDFRPRPKGLPEELLEHGVCLDEVLKIEGYDKLKSIFLQTAEEEEDQEEPAGNEDSSPGRKIDDDWDEDDSPGRRRKAEEPAEDEEDGWDWD